MLLLALLREHRERLAADFPRFYGIPLSRVRDHVTLWEFAAMAANLPPESATIRSLNLGHEHTHELELARRIDWSMQWLVWVKAGAKWSEYPEMYRFPWEPEPDLGWRGDAMTTDEAADFLGWPHLHAV